jgi:glycosyltransferase involved in cell wall biosynthesis
MNKVLILLLCYNRPTLILDTLKSIKESTYKNFVVACIDDGSDIPTESIVRSQFSKEELDKTVFYRIDDSKEAKTLRGGSIIGEKMNQAMRELECDLAIFLCDDDLLLPNYLENLNKYFTDNPKVMYAYSHVRVFHPGEDPRTKEKEPYWFNKTDTIDPFCALDASQVCWRVKAAVEGEIWFPVPKTANLDADFYGPFCEKHGPCPYMGFDGQLKRLHKAQLGQHSSLDYIDYEKKL